jgi:D-alanyl-D-alanine carboxypeptidase
VPPVRRKRYRYRLRRLTPVGFLVVLAGFGGAWVGSHKATDSFASNVPVPVTHVRLAAAAAHPVLAKKPTAAPERLLTGGSLVRHEFSPRLATAAAVLVDAKTGRVLWGRNAHERRQVASTTKIMTALIAFRTLRPNDVVTVDKSVPRVPLVREGLRAGERVAAWKLFTSMLLFSGNDDALALAIASSGDKWTFIRAMNAEADKLGLRDTHFSSPSGVRDADNYSSAWDLAALTRVAMRNDRFRKIVRMKIAHVKWSAPTYAKIYVNNNRLLTSYTGADGVKTGYTHKAGPCLVASATRGKVSLIAVVLDSSNMYGDATRLLDLGFASLG